MESTQLAIASCHLPEGVAIQPRRFEWRELASVPQYWFAGSPLITHMENAFSILIPPGERFFIQSVRNYEHAVTDPEQKALVRAFVQQEGQHIRAHNELNRSLGRFGVDVEREVAHAERAIGRLQRLPKKMQLGATAFLEHLTAISARLLFTEPMIAAAMPHEMVRFWSWHAAEEIEHKAVAYDVFKTVGGGYFLRVLSALAAMLLLAGPFRNSTRRMLRDDGKRVSKAQRQRTRSIQRKLAIKQLSMLLAYFKPGFHPWKHDDRPELARWYSTPELSAGPSEAPAVQAPP